MSAVGRFTMGFKTALQSGCGRLGYRLVKIPRSGTSDASSPYDAIQPLATYAPWRADREFQEVMRLIQGNTLVDIYRCWELWALLPQTAHVRGAVLEVGVWRGGTGALLAERARRCGITDPVYLCDTFEGVVKAGSQDEHYRGGEHRDTSRAVVERLISTVFHCDNVRILQGIFPDETAGAIDPGTKFRFCHIDVDVYESARDVTEWIWERLANGGVIVYDDFGFYGCNGITRLVEEQVSRPGRIVLHNLNGHAVVVKVTA